MRAEKAAVCLNGEMKMKEILFRNADELTGCQVQDGGVLFGEGSAARFSIRVPKAGYYAFVFESSLIGGDGRHDFTVTGEAGDAVCYRVSFPFIQRETRACFRLSAGENTIVMTGVFGSGVFYRLQYADLPFDPPCSLSPTRDLFYRDHPRELRIHLIHYDKKPIEIRWAGGALPFSPRPSQEDGLLPADAFIRCDLMLPPDALAALPAGEHALQIVLDDGTMLPYDLTVAEKDEKAPFEILNFNVHHGNSTLFSLPNGRHLLIDSGQEAWARDLVVPYLQKNGVHVDYYLLTHFHEDHDGLLEEILAQNGLEKPDMAKVESTLEEDAEKRYPYLARFGYLDSRMVRPFDRLDKIWDLGGVEIIVLNSRLDEAGRATIDMTDENNSSTSLAVSYGGFRYHHGADNYASAEERIWAAWQARGQENCLKCDYFYGNHHFHGSVSAPFIRFLNPEAVFVSAQAAVYARAAYTTLYREGVQERDYPGKRLRDTLLSCEVGSVRVKVQADGSWRFLCLDEV